MSSLITIVNYALTKLGEPNPLLALTDQTTPGRTMNRIYAAVRDAELRRGRWNFAIVRTKLSALTTSPEWGYQYQYPLPAGFLSLVQVNDYFVRPSKQQTLWQLESGNILTDLPPQLRVRYVQRVENTGLWDPLFVEAYACKLAHEGCEQITGSSSKKQELMDEYKAAMMEALGADAIENPPDELPWGSWLDSREGDGYGTDVSSSGTLYPGSSVVL